MSTKKFFMHFYYRKLDGPEFSINIIPKLDMDWILLHEAVLIWENQGAFKLIPWAVLKNTEIGYKETKKAGAQYPHYPNYLPIDIINWTAGHELSIAAAWCLLSDDASDELTNPNTAPESHGEDKPDQP